MKKYQDVQQLEPQAVVDIYQSGEAMVLVDTRTEKEQQVSMLPGAIRQQDFLRDKAKYKQHFIISYCTIGERSSQFSRELSRHGFRAANLRGSILAWAHAGYLVYDPEGKRTSRVHVYGPKWDLLPDGYVGVSSLNYWDKL